VLPETGASTSLTACAWVVLAPILQQLFDHIEDEGAVGSIVITTPEPQLAGTMAVHGHADLSRLGPD
jgi:hypothetical protein